MQRGLFEQDDRRPPGSRPHCGTCTCFVEVADPRARTTDPDTAHFAAESLHGYRFRDRLLTRLIREHPGETIDEQRDRMRCDKVAMSSIPARLKKAGLIHYGTRKINPRTGRPNLTLWPGPRLGCLERGCRCGQVEPEYPETTP